MKHIPIREDLIPGSLENAAREYHSSWSVFSTSGAGAELRFCKAEEQQGLCAYCECRLIDADGKLPPGVSHIDHFYQQARFPHLRFVWENMFLSCKHRDSCGVYKDRQELPSESLLNPHDDHPRSFITFVPVANHHASPYLLEATPLPGLSPEHRKKAGDTIKALNLNSRRLSRLRYETALKYRDVIRMLLQLLTPDTDEELLAYLMQEARKILAEMEQDEFPSALRAYAMSELGALADDGCNV